MDNTGSVVPDNETQNNTINNPNIPQFHNKKRKRKNKNKNKNQNKQKQLAKKKTFKRKPIDNSASKAVLTMTAWAEQFTFAATWQLKHQLAYWKAKAKSLEYENGVLHDLIRKNHYVSEMDSAFPRTSKMSDLSDDETEHTELNMDEERVAKEGEMGKWENTQGIKSHTMTVDHSENSDDISDEKQNIEVSEEFIQFLMVNAKHKEQVRLERERLNALEEKTAMEEREKKLKARRHYGLSMEELYGDKWQKITALEMSMKSSLMANVDNNMPAYWPVIPFNFESGDC